VTHALADFIQKQADERGWGPTELGRASGHSRQLAFTWLNDRRTRLPRLPARKTLAGFAKAFGVSEEFLVSKAIEALGLGYTSGDFINSVENATDQQLLAQIEKRLSARAQGGVSDTSTVTPHLAAVASGGSTPEEAAAADEIAASARAKQEAAIEDMDKKNQGRGRRK
jgi:hypothetical protein